MSGILTKKLALFGILYYKILISSRAATISWWDRRFRLSPPAVAGVWLRLCRSVGQLCKLQRRFHRRSLRRAAQPQEGRLETGQQDAILPHYGSRIPADTVERAFKPATSAFEPTFLCSC